VAASARAPGLFKLTWPILIESLLHVSTGAIATLMVSHVSDHAVAALGVANQLMNMAITLFQVIAVGSVVVVGQLLGAGDQRAVRHASTIALLVNALIGIATSALLAACAPSLLGWMNLPATMLPDGMTYLTIAGGGIAAEAVSLTLSAVLRAHGYARDGMFVTLGVNVLALVCNGLLIFGLAGAPALGVLGAAISILLSRMVGMLALFRLLHWRLGFAPQRRYLRGAWLAHLKQLFAIGLPAGGEMLSWMVMFSMVTSFTARVGPTALAAQAYVLQVVWLMVTFVSALGSGIEILISRLVGANQLDEAYRQLMQSLKLGLLVTFGLASLVSVAGSSLVHWFSADPAVVALAGGVLALSLLLEPGRVFNLIVLRALRAAGDARFPFLMGVLSMWGIAVPLAWLLGLYLGWGLKGIWLALAIDEWVRGLAMLARWRSRAWVGKRLVSAWP
jgi:putative MATE family efflux protein